MNALPCPYCHRVTRMPPPKAAGKLFACPFCKMMFLFTGVGAMAVPQDQPNAQPIPDPRPVPTVNTKANKIAGGIVTFLGVFFFLAFITWAADSSTSPEYKRSQDRENAFYMAQVFVQKRLKAPSTAHFLTMTDDGCGVEELGGGRYRVVGYVDAQNGFGAQIRTGYECWVAKVDAENWRLEDMKMNE